MGQVLLNEAQQQKWEVRRQQTEGDVAGLFRGWKPKGFDNSSAKILYVGKATSGRFHESDAESTSFNGKGAFWDFARRIAATVGCSSEKLDCIAWTNISKISRWGINADPTLLDGFENEAIDTLLSEIDSTDPDVIVFVTGHFHEQIVRHIADGFKDSAWTKSEETASGQKVDDVWWRYRQDGTAVLWMRHPMFAKSELLEFAAKTITLLS